VTIAHYNISYLKLFFSLIKSGFNVFLLLLIKIKKDKIMLEKTDN
jgi:hypothetical protein